MSLPFHLRFIPLFTILYTLVGCQQLNQLIDSSSYTTYEPQGKTGFIISDNEQQDPYSDFCRTTDPALCYKDTLPYQDYVEKKGYFETLSPVKTVQGYHFWSVVFEDGLKRYYRKYQDRNLFSSSDPFCDLKTYDLYSQRQPLIPNTTIEVIRGKCENSEVYGVFSNSEQVSHKNFPLLKKLATYLGRLRDQSSTMDNEDAEELRRAINESLDILTRMDLVFDPIYNNINIEPRAVHLIRSRFQPYILIRKEQEAILRVLIQYYTGDKIGSRILQPIEVQRLYIITDDDPTIYVNEKITWSSKTHRHGVIGWANFPLDRDLFDILEKISTANNTLIRFEGRARLFDFEVPQTMRRQITDTMKVFIQLQKAFELSKGQKQES